MEKEGYLQSAMTIVPQSTEKFESSLIRIKTGLGGIISKGYVHEEHKSVMLNPCEGNILELPLQFQIYRFICRNSESSLSLPNIQDAFHWHRSIRSLEKIVKGLQSENLIKFQKEFTGRSRTNVIVPNKNSKFYEMVMNEYPTIAASTSLAANITTISSHSKLGFCPKCFAASGMDCQRCQIYDSIRHQESSTAIRRLTILEDIVNEEKVCRLSKKLVQRIFKERADSNLKVSEPDSRGLTKLSKLLSRLKRVQLLQVNIDQINGESKPVMLLIHKDLNPSDPVVQSFIDTYQSDILVGSSNPNKGKKPEMTVVQQEAHRLLNYSDQENELGPAPVSRLKSEGPKITGNPAYIKPINVRNIIFHRWIFENSVEGDHILLFNTILREIPVGLFVKVFYVSQHSDELDLYLSDEGNYSSPMKEMPNELRLIINKRYRDCILRLVNRSAELGLCQKMDLKDGEFIPVENDVFAPYVKVLRTVKRFEFHENPPIEKGVLELTNSASIDHYWSVLQSECMAKVESLREETGREQSNFFPVQFRGLFSPLQWTVTPNLTFDIRDKLKVYIDVRSGETPLGNEALCKSISERTGISLEQLKFFFRREQSRILREVKPSKPVVTKKNSIRTVEEKSDFRNRIYWSDINNKMLIAGYIISRHYADILDESMISALFPFIRSATILNARARKLKRDPRYNIMVLKMENYWLHYLNSITGKGQDTSVDHIKENFETFTKQFLTTFESEM